LNRKIYKILKTKEIYLTRHGETEYNRLGIVQGSGVDSELNDLGKRQAEAFFEAYQHISFDRVYTSALKRTIQSVEKFIEMGLPHEIYAGLNEMGWGPKEGKRVTPEEDILYFKILEEWKKGNTHLPIEGGESPLQVLERQKPVLDLMMSRHEEERILICMHGRAMRVFLCLLLNYELKDMDMFEHTNLCLYKITFTGRLFTIDSYEVAHLEGLEKEMVKH
jgi:broad specificity phosphatase PhoE